MPDRRRYTTREFPAMKGDSVTLSFRVSKAVNALLTERLAAKPVGIESRTDALQDALVVWLLLEEPRDAG